MSNNDAHPDPANPGSDAHPLPQAAGAEGIPTLPAGRWTGPLDLLVDVQLGAVHIPFWITKGPETILIDQATIDALQRWQLVAGLWKS